MRSVPKFISNIAKYFISTNVNVLNVNVITSDEAVYDDHYYSCTALQISIQAHMPAIVLVRFQEAGLMTFLFHRIVFECRCSVIALYLM